ncbi:MAG: hypothetical protein M0R17_09510 [Candidatus Omnitrophica bacterium]|jgi:hypothetical protein|nr:hypothetical protein [Candidatus Omnitrophota bacterium]
MKKKYFDNFIRNKRGSLVDPIFSSAYILKIVIVILIALVIWTEFSNVMSTIISGTSSESVLTPVISMLTNAYLSMDYMFPILVGGLIIVSTIFAFKTGANIAWGILSIILWALAWLLATVFTNVYISITNEFPLIYVQFPIMDAIMMNMRWVVLAWIAVISAVMFRKNNQEDEYSEAQRRAYG